MKSVTVYSLSLSISIYTRFQTLFFSLINMKIKYGLPPHTEILSNSESESHDEYSRFRRVATIPASSGGYPFPASGQPSFRRLLVLASDSGPLASTRRVVLHWSKHKKTLKDHNQSKSMIQRKLQRMIKINILEMIKIRL